ncbi:MAG: hypothetical protein GY719_33910 [bacterium]|nr:hypothetical protein [bacterium]
MTQHSHEGHPGQKRRDEAVDRLRAELRRKVRESDLTQRAIEEENGFTRGYLSQVLQGHVTLTARHVFGILFALDIAPGPFFQRLMGESRRDAGQSLSEIRERMARYDDALEQLERKGLIGPGEET